MSQIQRIREVVRRIESRYPANFHDDRFVGAEDFEALTAALGPAQPPPPLEHPWTLDDVLAVLGAETIDSELYLPFYTCPEPDDYEMMPVDEWKSSCRQMGLLLAYRGFQQRRAAQDHIAAMELAAGEVELLKIHQRLDQLEDRFEGMNAQQAKNIEVLMALAQELTNIQTRLGQVLEAVAGKVWPL